MNTNFPSELLSAYLDGEATAAETQQVEELLASSPEARQQLEELQRLTAGLNSLPRESAPPEFQSAVMQAAERATLLPDVVDQHSAPPARPIRKSRSTLFLIWGSLGTTVAVCLLVAIQPQHTNSIPELVDFQATPAANRVSELSNVETEAVMAKSSAQSNFLADGAADSATEAAPQPPSADVSSTVAAGNASNTDSSNTVAGSSLIFDDTLNQARIGEVIQALDVSDQRIAVVKLTVVDRQESLKSLQVLLTRNQIPVTPQSDNAAAANKTQSQNALVAVYVEATSDQLNAALSELQDYDEFRELFVQNPIEVASLDSESRMQLGFEEVGGQVASVDRKRSPQSAESAKSPKSDNKQATSRSAAKPGASQLASKAAPADKPSPAADGEAPAVRAEGVLATNKRSRQLPLVAASKPFTAELEKRADAEQATQSQQARRQQPAPAVYVPAKDKHDQMQRTLQVLFLIVGQPEVKPAGGSSNNRNRGVVNPKNGAA